MKRTAFLPALVLGLWVWGSPLQAAVWFLNLSKAANMGPGESFDEAVPGIQDLQKKSGLEYLPSGPQTFRGVPFQLMNPSANNGRSYVVLKGRRKSNFPDAVSIPGDHQKAAYLYFLHTCRWGGTASNITAAEYDVVYDDGKVEIIPLHVGVELTNFWGADDTANSYLAWWYKYKNAEMGVNLFGWKNPRPEEPIQSILFKSPGKMPVPILFAVTGSDKELLISSQSPKPEKTFQTDTKNWISFEYPDGNSIGTALDMSFLFDEPAGKHGVLKVNGEKLIFEDGTEARFWGTELPLKNLLGVEGQGIQDSAAKGFNLISVYVPQGETVAPNLQLLVDRFKAKGIYIDLSRIDRKDIPTALMTDPAVIVQDPWSSGKFYRNLPSEPLTIPLEFQDQPQVMSPENSLPGRLVLQRSLGIPYGVEWANGWPNEYLAESPLLMAAYGSFEDWKACINVDLGRGLGAFRGQEKNDGIAASNLIGNLLQGPVAALAYLRGDLKEGKTYVLEARDNGPDKLTALKTLAHHSGMAPNGGVKTDRGGELKAKINEKTDSFISDTGQINWQGNVGIVKIDSPRFQALIGFLGNRKFNNNSWAVETSNNFASISAISLTKTALPASDHVLITGVTRMENTGMVYNQAKTKLLDAGKAPILVEPLKARIVLYRYQATPSLKVRALDAGGQPLKTKVAVKWVKNSMVLSWVPGAFYLEITK